MSWGGGSRSSLQNSISGRPRYCVRPVVHGFGRLSTVASDAVIVSCRCAAVAMRFSCVCSCNCGHVDLCGHITKAYSIPVARIHSVLYFPRCACASANALCCPGCLGCAVPTVTLAEAPTPTARPRPDAGAKCECAAKCDCVCEPLPAHLAGRGGLLAGGPRPWRLGLHFANLCFVTSQSCTYKIRNCAGDRFEICRGVLGLTNLKSVLSPIGQI